MKNLLLLFLLPTLLQAQLPDSTQKRIDNLFRSFTNSTPGCAVAIIKDSTIIFQKGYGMANLEYDIPIDPSTTFHIASESKQYVAFCMLLLEKEGKLSLDDDIRKHLSYVPDFGNKITIRHLIHHTSGLRDQWQLLANAGWQLDDVITLEHVTKLVSKQKDLNFKPGEEHMYCNTGYTLMAEIVKKISGLSLRDYTQKNIFEPLGMTSTHFHDNYQELVKNRAYSYSMTGRGKFQHAVLSYSIVGATSLHTTVQDETKWLNNFATGQVGGRELIEKMHQPGLLNDGRKLDYAFAINLDKFKGWQMIGHGGGDAGFRTYACRIPEKNLGIVVFSNLASVNPTGLARQVAGILVSDEKPGSGAPDKTTKPAKSADSSLLKKLQGRYYTERGEQGEMYWKDGTLFRGSAGSSNKTALTVTSAGNNRFVIQGGPTIILDQKNLAADSIMEMRMENPTYTGVFKRHPRAAKKITAEYVGTYYNDETEASYRISFINDTLRMEHRKFSTVPMKNIAPDQFTVPNWWMSHIRFLRDKSGTITAFEVNDSRVQHLKYVRK